MGERILMKGNEALAEGAVRAGCRFFAGYPITPQNEVPEYMSWRMAQVGGTFIQAESEVAAINMLFGASACGARVMTSSSSPGISLKQEGISYTASAELPIFYANVTRGGPGLGNIAPSQGDYYQATRGGGHGDYRVIVLAPNSVNDMGNFPKMCYDLAFKYRIPSMVLADGVLGQMMEPLEFNFEPIDPKKLPEGEWALGNAEGRERKVVRSYDLKPGGMEKHNWKLDKKYKEIEEKEVLYQTFSVEDADILIVAFGTCSRIAKSVLGLGRSQKLKIGLLRPITLWPFPTKILNQLTSKIKKILVVEMNLGQMLDDVKIAVEGKAEIGFHGRPAGGIPTPEEILDRVKQMV
ncbi:MAG: 3-methyl-2-oxobutanoate dehydrogenase subunit VorB [candidate division Zixibacteria bacterium]|nr:3-methyl-2-oxobutanoate dehydrogenase subunit VorB [candidate division Zixibacteria bacterium]